MPTTKAKSPSALVSPHPQASPVLGSEERSPIIRIEHYLDPDPEHPSAFMTFKNRMSKIHHELDMWATMVVDSMTFMEIAARYESEFHLNVGVKDRRQHYAFSTDEVERIAIMRLGSMVCNVLVLCHVNDTKVDMDGRTLFSVDGPGRLPSRAPSGYSEFYYQYVDEDEDKNPVYCLQTRSSRTHGSASQIDAPNPCLAHYEELWANWPADEEREALHCLGYGHSGAGKSHFAATWPKPIIVFAFDLLGKERPYRKLGRSERVWDEQFGIVVDNVYEV